MTPQAAQWIVFGTLAAALVLFASGRWRYDVVALLALMVVALAGIVPSGEVFSGFGHPAVVTVAAVLVVSRGLQNSGVVDVIAARLGRLGNRPVGQVLALVATVTVASAFMNNVGALALLLPVAIRMARKSGTPASVLLMPLAFGSLLGGLTTLIGTPPNIIIATFRAQNGAGPFGMFDFTPVGGAVALVGVLFVSLVGWRLIPQRKGQASREDLFDIEGYMSELRVRDDAKVAGQTVREVETSTEGDVVIVGLIRGERRLPAPSGFEVLRAGDVLVVKADPEALKTLVEACGLELVGSKGLDADSLGSDEVSVVEAVVAQNAAIDGKTPRGLNLRWRYGLNLLGLSRQGEGNQQRLKSIRIQAGDILLLQGRTDAIPDALTALGLLPLAERGLRLGPPRRILHGVGLFGAALAAAASGLLPVQTAFVAAALLMVLTGLLSLREVYESIDGPIIILLGAMIPIGRALEATGGARTIASGLLALGTSLPPVATLALVLIGTMFLSDVINNAAAAVLMAPIAVNVAAGLGASADPFLMAVAIGASCAFLTPIGHQSNTLVMGPGGYRFGDYWRMGLPLEALIVAVALPLLLWVWPLAAR
ncbi:MAG: SLC13 family permease [Armatimonadota bacterium]|nr:SLC13 family permease [Armatimonadota bacterium]